MAKIRVHYRIRKETYDAVVRHARLMGITQTAVVEMTLSSGLREYDAKVPPKTKTSKGER